MQGVAAGFARRALARGSVELFKFCLELLIDQQQCLQCTADVAIAARNDFVDSGVICSESHRILRIARRDNLDEAQRFLWIKWISPRFQSAISAREIRRPCAGEAAGRDYMKSPMTAV